MATSNYRNGAKFVVDTGLTTGETVIRTKIKSGTYGHSGIMHSRQPIQGASLYRRKVYVRK